MPCATVTDPDTMMRTTFREDGTTILYYNDKTIVEFGDGTKILTTEDYYFIESPCYAPVKITKPNNKYEVFLSNGFKISNSEDIKIESLYNHISCKENLIKIDSFFLDLQSSTIYTTDSIGNYYQVGVNSEPKQVIINKSENMYTEPFLYVIDNNGDGVELLNEFQVNKKLFNKAYTKTFTNVDGLDFECYLAKNNKTAHEKGHLSNSLLHDYKYPKILGQIKDQPRVIQDDEENF